MQPKRTKKGLKWLIDFIESIKKIYEDISDVWTLVEDVDISREYSSHAAKAFFPFAKNKINFLVLFIGSGHFISLNTDVNAEH
jgi:hypothetical protein